MSERERLNLGRLDELGDMVDARRRVEDADQARQVVDEPMPRVHARVERDHDLVPGGSTHLGDSYFEIGPVVDRQYSERRVEAGGSHRKSAGDCLQYRW